MIDNNKYLDKEEKDIMESFERGEWEPVSKKEAEKNKAEFKKAVITTQKKRRLENQKISINIFKSDLPIIREKAEHEGLPYQTLIKRLVHKYATGQIKLK